VSQTVNTLPPKPNTRRARRFDPEMSWIMDWLQLALEAETIADSRHAVRRALAIVEQKAMG
jgi:hypothetical protein